MRKIKVFLGAYINVTNAQNLNCYALAKCLDKEKFDIYTLKLYSGNLPIPQISGVSIFNCFYPHKISKYLGYLWGIIRCDVAYLPKGEASRWCVFWLKVLKKKSFITIEVNLSEGSDTKMYRGFSKAYAITQYVREHSIKLLNLYSEKKILYLGVETEVFSMPKVNNYILTDVVFIGYSMIRKGIFEYLALTQIYPRLMFHIVGEPNEIEKRKISAVVSNYKFNKNIKFHGLLDHQALAILLKKCNLHVFPSRKIESWGKVTMETAAAGVPSIIYSDYGAKEWITHGHDGFIVNDFYDIVNTIKMLIVKPDLLYEVSRNAIKLAEKFSWHSVIKDWENEIIMLAQGREYV